VSEAARQDTRKEDASKLNAGKTLILVSLKHTMHSIEATLHKVSRHIHNSYNRNLMDRKNCNRFKHVNNI